MIKIETERLVITEMTMDMAMDVHKNSLDEDIRRFAPDEQLKPTTKKTQSEMAVFFSYYPNFCLEIDNDLEKENKDSLFSS